jgi:type II secretory pathway pseudopilin PulG
MREDWPARDHGLTILETIVVVLLLLLGILFLMPAVIRHGDNVAHACLGQATAWAIATSIRVYANNYDGWTHPDPSFYPKFFGYRLRGDPGWSVEEARCVSKFVCPSDPSPMLHPHGYPSSFFVTPFFAGANVVAPFGSPAPDGSWAKGVRDPTCLPVVVEAGPHHRLMERLERVYVFADMHSSVGLACRQLPWPE